MKWNQILVKHSITFNYASRITSSPAQNFPRTEQDGLLHKSRFYEEFQEKDFLVILVTFSWHSLNVNFCCIHVPLNVKTSTRHQQCFRVFRISSISRFQKPQIHGLGRTYSEFNLTCFFTRKFSGNFVGSNIKISISQ